ncbi:MAG: phosphoribosylglycinamide formyltransferase [Propionibacteriaceae bacterium]|jgi:formyltetrahydrofolate-dependent phosphoribosylglycinamide formyltransferase|nr:phosphoribosylglycinamide formyltransferase [Propionibacteriaceae bacterium]
MPEPQRLVVLISGTGTLLQSLLDACASGELDAVVVAVGADRDAEGLSRARQAGIDTFVVPLSKDLPRTTWDQQLTAAVAAYHPDLVISAGFMKLVGQEFLAHFGGRFINTHPALLPSFPGVHGVRDALAAGVKVSGCTVFAVDEGIDTGAIIAQEAVSVLPNDDEQTLHERIKTVERRLLVEVVKNWRNNDWA